MYSSPNQIRCLPIVSKVCVWLALTGWILIGKAVGIEATSLNPGIPLLDGVDVKLPFIEKGTRFKDVSCGFDFTLAVTESGKVVGWGRNRFGVCDPPSEVSDVVKVAASGMGSFGVALRADGTVVAWGGQEDSMRIVPEGLQNVIAISAGDFHALALKSDGSVVGWGSIRLGGPEKLQFPSDIGPVKAIHAADDVSYFVLEDGSFWQYSKRVAGKVSDSSEDDKLIGVAGPSNNLYHLYENRANLKLSDIPVTMISAGRGYGASGFGTTAEGLLLGNSDGDYPEGLNQVVQVSSSLFNTHHYARLKNGTLVGWGETGHGWVPFEIVNRGVLDWDWVLNSNSTSAYVYLFVLSDGSVVGFGNNDYEHLDIPDGLKAVSIRLHPRRAFALTSEGRVVVWGDSRVNFPMPATLDQVVAIDSGEEVSGSYPIALRRDGTVVYWPVSGEPGFAPPAEDLEDVVAIASGRYHGIALKRSGKVIGWVNRGQTSLAGRVPSDLENVVMIAASWDRNLALKEDGTLVAWGRPEVPAEVLASVPPVRAISMDRTRTYVLLWDGRVLLLGSTLQEVPGHYDCTQILGRMAFQEPFRIRSIDNPGPARSIKFQSFMGRRYSVEFATDLGVNAWRALINEPLLGTGEVLQVEDENRVEGGARFYRLQEVE